MPMWEGQPRRHRRNMGKAVLRDGKGQHSKKLCPMMCALTTDASPIRVCAPCYDMRFIFLYIDSSWRCNWRHAPLKIKEHKRELAQLYIQ